MNTAFMMFIMLLAVDRGQASSPVQDVLLNGLQIISRILQNNEESPISFLFDNMKTMLSGQERTPPKGDEDDDTNSTNETTGLWQTIFQSLGFKSKQFPDIALNILMFLIKMISTSLTSTKTNYSRDFTNKDSTVLNLVINQPQVSRLMSQMQDPGLMVNVLKEVESRLSDSLTDCPIQLMCRSTPVVRGMQTSLAFFMRQRQNFATEKRTNRGETEEEDNENDPLSDLEQMDLKWKKLSPLERFFYFMPSIEDFVTTSALCRRKYPNCR